MLSPQTYITPILSYYIKKYVINPSLRSFEVSLWEGDVTLKNLDLDLVSLQEQFDFPLQFVRGHVGELRIHVPWSNLLGEPISVHLDTIECIVKLGTTKSTATKTAVETRPESYMSSVLRKIINNINVNFQNIIIKLVEDDIILSLNIKEVSCHSVSKKWSPEFISNPSVLRKKLVINDLTVCLDQSNVQGKIEYYQDPILFKSSITGHLLFVYNGSNLRKCRIDLYCEQMNFSLSNMQLPLLYKLSEAIHKTFSEIPSTQENNFSSDAATNVPETSWFSWIPISISWSENDEEVVEEDNKKTHKNFHVGLLVQNISLSFKVAKFSKLRNGVKFLRIFAVQGYHCRTEFIIDNDERHFLYVGMKAINALCIGDCLCGAQRENKLVFSLGTFGANDVFKSSLFDPLVVDDDLICFQLSAKSFLAVVSEEGYEFEFSFWDTNAKEISLDLKDVDEESIEFYALKLKLNSPVIKVNPTLLHVLSYIKECLSAVKGISVSDDSSNKVCYNISLEITSPLIDVHSFNHPNLMTYSEGLVVYPKPTATFLVDEFDCCVEISFTEIAMNFTGIQVIDYQDFNLGLTGTAVKISQSNSNFLNFKSVYISHHKMSIVTETEEPFNVMKIGFDLCTFQMSVPAVILCYKISESILYLQSDSSSQIFNLFKDIHLKDYHSLNVEVENLSFGYTEKMQYKTFKMDLYLVTAILMKQDEGHLIFTVPGEHAMKIYKETYMDLTDINYFSLDYTSNFLQGVLCFSEDEIGFFKFEMKPFIFHFIPEIITFLKYEVSTDDYSDYLSALDSQFDSVANGATQFLCDTISTFSAESSKDLTGDETLKICKLFEISDQPTSSNNQYWKEFMKLQKHVVLSSICIVYHENPQFKAQDLLTDKIASLNFETASLLLCCSTIEFSSNNIDKNVIELPDAENYEPSTFFQTLEASSYIFNLDDFCILYLKDQHIDTVLEFDDFLSTLGLEEDGVLICGVSSLKHFIFKVDDRQIYSLTKLCAHLNNMGYELQKFKKKQDSAITMKPSDFFYILQLNVEKIDVHANLDRVNYSIAATEAFVSVKVQKHLSELEVRMGTFECEYEIGEILAIIMSFNKGYLSNFHVIDFSNHEAPYYNIDQCQFNDSHVMKFSVTASFMGRPSVTLSLQPFSVTVSEDWILPLRDTLQNIVSTWETMKFDTNLSPPRSSISLPLLNIQFGTVRLYHQIKDETSQYNLLLCQIRSFRAMHEVNCEPEPIADFPTVSMNCHQYKIELSSVAFLYGNWGEVLRDYDQFQTIRNRLQYMGENPAYYLNWKELSMKNEVIPFFPITNNLDIHMSFIPATYSQSVMVAGHSFTISVENDLKIFLEMKLCKYLLKLCNRAISDEPPPHTEDESYHESKFFKFSFSMEKLNTFIIESEKPMDLGRRRNDEDVQEVIDFSNYNECDKMEENRNVFEVSRPSIIANFSLLKPFVYVVVDKKQQTFLFEFADTELTLRTSKQCCSLESVISLHRNKSNFGASVNNIVISNFLTDEAELNCAITNQLVVCISQPVFDMILNILSELPFESQGKTEETVQTTHFLKRVALDINELKVLFKANKNEYLAMNMNKGKVMLQFETADAVRLTLEVPSCFGLIISKNKKFNVFELYESHVALLSKANQIKVYVTSKVADLHVSPIHVKFLKTVIDTLFPASTQNKVSQISVDKHAQKKYYTDDLRSGKFNYSEQEDYTPYTISFNDEELSMTWCYPEERTVVSVYGFPVPLRSSFESFDSDNIGELECELHYLNLITMKYELMTKFSLSEFHETHFELEKDIDCLNISSTIWKIVISDSHCVVSPKLLAGSIGVDSCIIFNEDLKLETEIEIPVLKINLWNYGLHDDLDSSYSTNYYLLFYHPFISAHAENLVIKGSMCNSFYQLLLNGKFSVEFCNYRFFISEVFLAPSILKIFSSGSKKFDSCSEYDINFETNSLEIYISQSFIHCLSTNLMNWSQNSHTTEDQCFSKAIPYCQYLVNNDTNTDLIIRQANTKQSLLVEKGCSLEYAWHSNYKSAQLELAQSAKKVFWCDPFPIKKGQLTRALKYDGTNTCFLFINIVKTESSVLQLRITGQIILMNLTYHVLNFKFIDITEEEDDVLCCCEPKTQQTIMRNPIQHAIFKIKGKNNWSNPLSIDSSSPPHLVNIENASGDSYSCHIKCVSEVLSSVQKVLLMVYPVITLFSNMPMSLDIELKFPNNDVRNKYVCGGYGKTSELVCLWEESSPLMQGSITVKQLGNGKSCQKLALLPLKKAFVSETTSLTNVLQSVSGLLGMNTQTVYTRMSDFTWCHPETVMEFSVKCTGVPHLDEMIMVKVAPACLLINNSGKILKYWNEKFSLTVPFMTYTCISFPKSGFCFSIDDLEDCQSMSENLSVNLNISESHPPEVYSFSISSSTNQKKYYFILKHSFEQETHVFLINSKVSVCNLTSYEISLFPFCSSKYIIPQNSMLSESNVIEAHKKGSEKRFYLKPMLSWLNFDCQDSNTPLYISLSIGRGVWSKPYQIFCHGKIPFDSFHVSYPANQNKVPVSLSLSLKEDDSKCLDLTISEICNPPVVICNNSSLKIYYSETTDDFCRVDQESAFATVLYLEPYSCGHYVIQQGVANTGISVLDNYPLIYLAILVDDAMNWSIGINMTSQNLQVSQLGPWVVKVQCEKLSATYYVHIEPMIRANTIPSEISLLEITGSEKPMKFNAIESIVQEPSFYVSGNIDSFKVIIRNDFKNVDVIQDALCILMNNISIKLSPQVDYTKELKILGNRPRQFRNLVISWESLQLENLLFNTKKFDFQIILSPQSPKSEEQVCFWKFQMIWDKASYQLIKLSPQPITLQLEDCLIYYWMDVFENYIPAFVTTGDKSVICNKEINILNQTSTRSFDHLLKIEELFIGELPASLSLHASNHVFISLNQSSLTLSPCHMFGISATPYDVGVHLSQLYMSKALTKAGWIIGSLEMFGSPSILAEKISNGISDFIQMPFIGLYHGPWPFVSGMVQGATSLLSNVTAGFLFSITNFSSFASRNLSILSLDEEHIARNEESRRLPNYSVLDGLSDFGVTILSAIGGLVHQPIQEIVNSETSFPTRFVSGIGKGLLGIVTKPLGGAADLVAKTGQGLLHNTGWLNIPQAKFIPEMNKPSNYSSHPAKFIWNINMISGLDLSSPAINFGCFTGYDNERRILIILCSEMLYGFDEEVHKAIISLPLKSLDIYIIGCSVKFFYSPSEDKDCPPGDHTLLSVYKLINDASKYSNFYPETSESSLDDTSTEDNIPYNYYNSGDKSILSITFSTKDIIHFAKLFKKLKYEITVMQRN